MNTVFETRACFTQSRNDCSNLYIIFMYQLKCGANIDSVQCVRNSICERKQGPVSVVKCNATEILFLMSSPSQLLHQFTAHSKMMIPFQIINWPVLYDHGIDLNQMPSYLFRLMCWHSNEHDMFVLTYQKQ